MHPRDLALPFTCLAAAVAWAWIAARRTGVASGTVAVRGFVGGAAAAALALVAYDVGLALGADVSWERVLRGDAGAFALAGAIGIVEEGAKLAGLLLFVPRAARERVVLAVAAGVAAAFAATEAFLVLRGAGAAPALLARAALGAVAHGLLLVPAALAVAEALRRRGRAWLGVGPGLLASAALHAAGDLSLAAPGAFGPIGYASALAVPALWLFARGRSVRVAPPAAIRARP